MKKILLFVLLLPGFVLFAQSAQSVSIDYNKTRVPGVSIVIAGYSADFVQSALTYRLEKVAGLKGTNSKGFRLYQAQNFHDFGTSKYDIYTYVNSGSKKTQAVTLNLMVSKGNENFVSPTDDPELTQKMKEFLTEFNNYIKEYDKIQKIDKISASISKLEKTRDSQISDRDKLKKSFDTLASKLKAKEDELSKTESLLQKSKEELNSLKR